MKTLYFLLVMSLINLHAVLAQTVSTFTDGTPDDAIILDADGNIYASNFVGDKVFKFDQQGNMEEFIVGLNTPNGLAFNTAGELYVCDFMAQAIYRYDADGNQLEFYSIAGRPSGIIKDKDSEDMIFTNFNTNSINRLDPDGNISLISEAEGLNGPVGLAYDDQGNLFAGNYNDRSIYLIHMDGTVDYVANPGDASNLGFIAYAQGKLWGTVLGEHKLYQIDPYSEDQVVHYAGSVAGDLDGDISEATFAQPNGILFDPSGETMYVTDFGTKNLRIISDVVTLGNPTPELPGFEIALYPSPVKDSLTVRLSEAFGRTLFSLYDIQGKLVLQQALEGDMQQIQLGHLSEGMYVAELVNQGTKRSQKIFKQ